MNIISNKKFDEERALYSSHEVVLKNCSFDGPADGESALKESTDIDVRECFCNLRYPFWHDTNLKISGSEMTGLCRAALWYSNKIEITDTKLHGIKALRECMDVYIKDCHIVSPEFGWFVNGITMKDSTAESEYFMMRSCDILFENVKLKGKYSFQYIEDAVFENCIFDTKDAFWHSKNTTVRNSVLKGEYLAWYSDCLTLENCKISGTQPFCYCKNLKLVNCEMTGTDLSFEKSEVSATVTTHIDSVKNPLSGSITAPSVGKIIMDDENAKGSVITKAQYNNDKK